MSKKSISLTHPPEGYGEWLTELKSRIHQARQRASLAVNHELILLYWQLGKDILSRQAEQGWGAKVIERLAHDLKIAFPDMKGFSRTNLMYMRAFAEAWPDSPIVQQPAGQLPWFHLCTLLDKLKTREERDWYAARAVDHNWSRNILVMRIETRLREREGSAITHLGRLGFYLTAVDRRMKDSWDQPTIGLLLCKNKNNVVAEYALGDKRQPMGIAEYKLYQALPESLETNLPSIELIERELRGKRYEQAEIYGTTMGAKRARRSCLM